MGKSIGNVLSLFDGMSCGQIALNRAGVNYESYFASEICFPSIKVAKMNYPQMHHIGDVRNINSDTLPNIDLILAGSPCQDLSFAKSGGDGLNGEKSALFYEFARLLVELKPKYFLLENVIMNKKFEDEISRIVGVSPLRINSSLVSAQNRDRLYWTNIKVKDLPLDKGIIIEDIMEKNVPDRFYVKRKFDIVKDSDSGCVANLRIRGLDVIKRCYGTKGKSPTITTVNGGNRHTKIYDRSVVTNDLFGTNTGRVRILTPLECERLQTVPDGYTRFAKEKDRYNMLGNGWTVDVICHILKHL